MNTKAKGYLLGAVAAATYGMNPLFALPLYKAGMDPDSVLFFRYLFAIPLLGTMLKARGRDFKLHRREIVPLVLLGLLVALSSLSLFLSYNYMDAGIASTLLFVYPIFVALIMAFGFREKLSPQTALCILLALAGIGLLFKGSDGSTLNITGTVLVMVSALSYAIYIVGVNRPVLKSVATLKVTFYVLLFDGKIVGCGGINLADERTTGKISWDILHPEYQGRSLGTRLLGFRIEKLGSLGGIRRITVRTSQLAFGFYRKQGFVLKEVKKDYWAEGFDQMTCLRLLKINMANR